MLDWLSSVIGTIAQFLADHYFQLRFGGDRDVENAGSDLSSFVLYRMGRWSLNLEQPGNLRQL